MVKDSSTALSNFAKNKIARWMLDWITRTLEIQIRWIFKFSPFWKTIGKHFDYFVLEVSWRRFWIWNGTVIFCEISKMWNFKGTSCLPSKSDISLFSNDVQVFHDVILILKNWSSSMPFVGKVMYYYPIYFQHVSSFQRILISEQTFVIIFQSTNWHWSIQKCFIFYL